MESLTSVQYILLDFVTLWSDGCRHDDVQVRDDTIEDEQNCCPRVALCTIATSHMELA